MPNIVVYEPANGPDIPQGDLLLTNLLHPDFGGRFNNLNPTGMTVRTEEGTVRLLEGEVTGHHHEILFGSKHLARFHDEALARQLEAKVGTARLVQDDKATAALCRSGHFDARRTPQLIVGFLYVEGGPVNLVHPEHDTWRIPEGLYYVGRQIENAGAEERTVQD